MGNRVLEEENKAFSNGHSTLVAFGGCEVGEFRIQRLDRDSPPGDDCVVGETCWNILYTEAVAGAAAGGQDV